MEYGDFGEEPALMDAIEAAGAATVAEGHEDLRDPALRLVRERGRFEHGCEHYRRRCRLVAPCCGEVFWCRHCHNKAKSEDEEVPGRRHELDRKLVRELLCALCGERQPASRHCRSCGVSFGAYGCLTCRFFEDETESRKQFHCEECGLCRIGGRESFFHCPTCGCCYSTSLQDNHQCVENSMKQNCPICFEFLFDSIQPTSVLRCGHTLHERCFHAMIENHQTSCPVCMKSFADMAAVWQTLEVERRETPMPVEYMNWQAHVHCNDCNTESTEAFHVAGQRCSGAAGCGSFNTRRASIDRRPATAEQRRWLAERLAEMQLEVGALESQLSIVPSLSPSLSPPVPGRDPSRPLPAALEPLAQAESAREGRVAPAVAQVQAAQVAAAQAIAHQVALAEARREEPDEADPQLQQARAAEQEAAEQLHRLVLQERAQAVAAGGGGGNGAAPGGAMLPFEEDDDDDDAGTDESD